MYISVGRRLGEVPSYTPWRARLGLRPKPQYLRFMNLDRFNWNEASLTPRLTQMARHLAEHVKLSWKLMRPIGFIRLVGHTDNTGKEQYNVDLGDRRARAVKVALEELLKEDIVKRRIAILVEPSPGPSRPTADNRTSEGRALNRRVEVFIAAPEPPPEPKKPIPPPEPPREPIIRTKPEPYWQSIPPGPKGKSFKDALIELCEKHFPPRLCPAMVNRILSGSCALLEELFQRAGGTLPEKQKEELRKQCREAAQRPMS
jgi:OmpA family